MTRAPWKQAVHYLLYRVNTLSYLCKEFTTEAINMCNIRNYYSSCTWLLILGLDSSSFSQIMYKRNVHCQSLCCFVFNADISHCNIAES